MDSFKQGSCMWRKRRNKQYDRKYLKDFKTPIEFELRRQNAGENGNLEGLYFKGVLEVKNGYIRIHLYQQD